MFGGGGAVAHCNFQPRKHNEPFVVPQMKMSPETGTVKSFHRLLASAPCMKDCSWPNIEMLEPYALPLDNSRQDVPNASLRGDWFGLVCDSEA